MGSTLGRKEATEAIIVGVALSFAGAAAEYVFERLRQRREAERKKKRTAPSRRKKT